MDKIKRKVVSVYPSDKLEQLIKKVCKKEGRNKNNLICHILERELPKYME